MSRRFLIYFALIFLALACASSSPRPGLSTNAEVGTNDAKLPAKIEKRLTILKDEWKTCHSNFEKCLKQCPVNVCKKLSEACKQKGRSHADIKFDCETNSECQISGRCLPTCQSIYNLKVQVCENQSSLTASLIEDMGIRKCSCEKHKCVGSILRAPEDEELIETPADLLEEENNVGASIKEDEDDQKAKDE